MALFDKKQTTALPPEVAECERQIAELDRRRAAAVMEIGQMFLENNTLESIAFTPYAEKATEISRIDKEKEYQEKRKLAVQGQRKCEKCGNILVLESAFCNKCGERLQPLFADEPAKQNVCPQCGAPYGEGAAFCISCGYRLS